MCSPRVTSKPTHTLCVVCPFRIKDYTTPGVKYDAFIIHACILLPRDSSAHFRILPPSIRFPTPQSRVGTHATLSRKLHSSPMCETRFSVVRSVCSASLLASSALPLATCQNACGTCKAEMMMVRRVNETCMAAVFVLESPRRHHAREHDHHGQLCAGPAVQRTKTNDLLTEATRIHCGGTYNGQIQITSEIYHESEVSVRCSNCGTSSTTDKNK